MSKIDDFENFNNTYSLLTKEYLNFVEDILNDFNLIHLFYIYKDRKYSFISCKDNDTEDFEEVFDLIYKKNKYISIFDKDNIQLLSQYNIFYCIHDTPIRIDNYYKKVMNYLINVQELNYE